MNSQQCSLMKVLSRNIYFGTEFKVFATKVWSYTVVSLKPTQGILHYILVDLET